MRKDDAVYLGHMKEFAEEALAMCAGYTSATFGGDRKTQLAVTHLIELMGEAASNVSADMRAATRTCLGRRSSACATG